MSLDAAESVAAEVKAGTYGPTALTACEETLAADRNPQFIRFVGLTLFADPRQPAWQKGRYLVLQPHALRKVSEAEQKKQIKERIRPLAERLLRDLPTSELPRPTDKVEKMREALRRIHSTTAHVSPEHRIRRHGVLDPRKAPRTDNLTDDELRSRYVEWLVREQDRLLRERLEGLASLVGEVRVGGPRVGTWTVDAVTAVLARVLYPLPFHHLDSGHAHVAVCAVHEQEWKLAGYTRGELVGSLSLAPGERLTLEVHSWDKSTRKTEDEISTESEIRTSEKLTQRDALTVAQEYAKKTNTKVDASGVVPISKMPIKLSGSVSTAVTQGLKRTTDSLREKTVEASNSLRVNRKTRIESSREVGREERQTRVVENTNRCHSLNCHYFEVLTNYVVTTRLIGVRPCVLLSNTRPDFTLDWVLCHQHILTEALLDKTFLPGFEAARRLKADEVLQRMRQARHLTELERLGDEVTQYVLAITTAFDFLKTSKDIVQEALSGCDYWVDCLSGLVDVPRIDVGRAVAWARIPVRARTALEMMSKERVESVNAAESLRRFFRTVTTADFGVGTSGAALEAELRALGFPEIGAKVFAGEDSNSLDDAGLRGAVEAAAGLIASLGPQTPEPGDAATEMEVADARVGFDQLQCHLNDNWLHYLQSVWAREDPGERFLRLQGLGEIASVIDNELLGFVADKSAYPLRETNFLEPLIDFNKLMAEAEKLIASQKPIETLVTQPTAGTVLEAVTGHCTACEDFIQTSRAIDLRNQDAKARAEETEARRREMRLAAAPPDLTDPTAQPPGEITVKIESSDRDSGG
ncbi:hypothetical protein ACFC0D_19010 [Streptomyces sp. NPDC056222]|uniref:hypothetical protein n=1 Tax=Streptomyces sp. NPDC056222 TaxID=3345749 RepID=UPI0035DB9D90